MKRLPWIAIVLGLLIIGWSANHYYGVWEANARFAEMHKLIMAGRYQTRVPPVHYVDAKLAMDKAKAVSGSAALAGIALTGFGVYRLRREPDASPTYQIRQGAGD